jgi:twitching motility protein PilI
MMPVPLTRPWFAGIANIRGNLHAVSDLAAYRGGPATPHNVNARLLLVGAKFGVNAALLVSRMLGLKNPEHFVPAEADTSVPAWAATRYRDGSGRLWRKLSVRDLLADQDFMNIGV